MNISKFNAFRRSRQRTPTVENFLQSDYHNEIIHAIKEMGIGRVEDFLLTNQNELESAGIPETKAKNIIERAKKYLNKNMPLQSYTQPQPHPQPYPHVSNTTEKDVYGPDGRIGYLTKEQMVVYETLDMWDKRRVNQLEMDIKRRMLNKGKDFVEKILKDAGAHTVVTLTGDMKLKIKNNVLSSQGGRCHKTQKSNRTSRHKYTKKSNRTMHRKQTKCTRH